MGSEKHREKLPANIPIGASMRGTVLSLAILTVIVLLLVMIGSSIAADPGHVIKSNKAMECPICGMYIRQQKSTAFELYTAEVKRLVYCGVACGLRDINHHGGFGYVKRGYATDWVVAKPLTSKRRPTS